MKIAYVAAIILVWLATAHPGWGIDLGGHTLERRGAWA